MQTIVDKFRLIIEALPLKVKGRCAGEALCPYCARFIDTVAARIHENGVMNITKFRYIPYGNAKESKVSRGGQHTPPDAVSMLDCITQ